VASRKKFDLNKFKNNITDKNISAQKSCFKQITFKEGLEDNFYTHLLDWKESIACLATKKGLKFFKPLNMRNELTEEMVNAESIKYNKLYNLNSLKFM
jgi:hypothetical protein